MYQKTSFASIPLYPHLYSSSNKWYYSPMEKDQLISLIKEYFLEAETNPKVHTTLPGLAEHLCMTVDQLINFSEDDPNYPIIQRAKLKCENYLVNQSMSGRVDKSIANLMLKTYFGYTDKKELNVKGKINISSVLDEIEHQP